MCADNERQGDVSLLLQAGRQAAVCDQLAVQSLGQAILSNDGEARGLSSAGTCVNPPRTGSMITCCGRRNAQELYCPKNHGCLNSSPLHRSDMSCHVYLTLLSATVCSAG